MSQPVGGGPSKSVSTHTSASALSLCSFCTAPVVPHNRGSRLLFDFSIDLIATTQRPSRRRHFPYKGSSVTNRRCSSSRCRFPHRFGDHAKGHRETRVFGRGVTSLRHWCCLCRLYDRNRGKDNRGETPPSLHILSSPRFSAPLLVVSGRSVNSFLFPGLFSSARESAPVLVWCVGTAYGSARRHRGWRGMDGVCGGRGVETVD